MSDMNKDIIGQAPKHNPPPDFARAGIKVLSDNLGKRYLYNPRGLQGGMATIHKGWDPRTNRQVAIKMNNIDEDRELFLNEAQLLARLDHPHIIKILDVLPTENSNQYAYVMRDFDPNKSPSLAQKLINGPLPQEKTIELATQIGSAIDYLRRKKIVHKDINFRNILVDPEYKFLLIDPGIAARPSSNLGKVARGTSLFISPEAYTQSQLIDFRSDLWGLGVTLYYALTRKPPFGENASTPEEIRDSILYHDLDPRVLEQACPERAPELKVFFGMALNKDPNRRFQSGKELADALRIALGV